MILITCYGFTLIDCLSRIAWFTLIDLIDLVGLVVHLYIVVKDDVFTVEFVGLRLQHYCTSNTQAHYYMFEH